LSIVNKNFRYLLTYSPFTTDHSLSHSVRKDLTGFATAAPIAWKLIVTSVIIKEISPAIRNIVQVMLIL
jgi:hypothetical protein